MQTNVLEVVTFRLSPDADEAAFIAAAEGTDRFLGSQKGFIRRRLGKAEEEGDWLDIAEWGSMTDAKAAAEAFMKDESVAPFVALIDMSSVTMRHYAVKVQFA